VLIWLQDFSYSMSSSSSSAGPGLLCTVASTSAAAATQAKIPAPIKEFLKSLDDQEWQSSLYSLLQNQTFNQVTILNHRNLTGTEEQH
jgi:hypothetical protein